MTPRERLDLRLVLIAIAVGLSPLLAMVTT